MGAVSNYSSHIGESVLSNYRDSLVLGILRFKEPSLATTNC